MTGRILIWKLIKQQAEEKDISHVAALEEVLPEYKITMRYRDEVFEEAAIQKWAKEMAELAERERKE